MANLEMQTITAERAKGTFNVEAVFARLMGGEKNLALRRHMEQLIQRDPVLIKKFFFDISDTENREKTLLQLRRAIEIMRTYDNDRDRAFFTRTMSLYDRSFGMRIGVHSFLFRQLLMIQGTDEQQSQWMNDIINFNVLGCFAMTELGHSSSLRGVETTATFDKAKQQFIIDSPTITATKWWIGMAGQTATHTGVLAQLIIDGSQKGLHWFIVPLRDRETGRLQPGVSAGHLGGKHGRGGLDNGWIQFTGVKIPRNNMLMRWASVSAEGNYKPVPIAAMAYATLVGERIWALEEFYNIVGQAITIATRYGVIRRQGPRDEQIMDYQSHQLSLMPIIASVYFSRILWLHLDTTWTAKVLEQSGPNANPAQFLIDLGDYHSLISGVKAYFSWDGAIQLEQIRRSMGGHAYSAYNAISGLIGDYGVGTTGAGDNVVLAQQCAKFLMSQFKRANDGKPLSPSAAFLANWRSDLAENRAPIHTQSDAKKPEVVIAAFKFLATHMIVDCAQRLTSGAKKEEAWNNNMDRLVDCGRPFVYYNSLETVAKLMANDKTLGGPERRVLEQCISLFGLLLLKTHQDWFLLAGYLTPQQCEWIREEFVLACKQLREQAVPLTDALGFPDWVLKAPLGRYDGDIYNSYLETVKAGTAYQDKHTGNPDGATNVAWQRIMAPTIKRNPSAKL